MWPGFDEVHLTEMLLARRAPERSGSILIFRRVWVRLSGVSMMVAGFEDGTSGILVEGLKEMEVG